MPSSKASSSLSGLKDREQNQNFRLTQIKSRFKAKESIIIKVNVWSQIHLWSCLLCTVFVPSNCGLMWKAFNPFSNIYTRKKCEQLPQSKVGALLEFISKPVQVNSFSRLSHWHNCSYLKSLCCLVNAMLPKRDCYLPYSSLYSVGQWTCADKISEKVMLFWQRSYCLGPEVTTDANYVLLAHSKFQPPPAISITSF